MWSVMGLLMQHNALPDVTDFSRKGINLRQTRRMGIENELALNLRKVSLVLEFTLVGPGGWLI